MTAALRARYVTDAVTTASPARLLVMLYDKLAPDLRQAEEALREGDRAVASGRLIHAQDIVLELLSSLDVAVWPEGKGLASLYNYLLVELAQANIHRDVDKVVTCHRFVSELGAAWHQAADSLAQGALSAGGTA
jgi:flagellar protein FliS